MTVLLLLQSERNRKQKWEAEGQKGRWGKAGRPALLLLGGRRRRASRRDIRAGLLAGLGRREGQRQIQVQCLIRPRALQFCITDLIIELASSAEHI